jgi:molybdopterin converting factor small subunit
MKVDVKCFATLANEDTCDYRQPIAYDLADGQTVGDLADRVGVAAEDVKITFVNGRQAGRNTVLAHGDRVGFVPPVGGM